MKKINFTAFFSYAMLIAIFFMAAHSLYQAKYEPTPVPAPTPAALSSAAVDPMIKNLVPEAVEVQQLSQNPWVIKIVKNDGSSVYGAIGKGEGHQSEISVLVIMSPDHKVTNISILSQGETPKYFQRLANSNFLSQFTGKDIGAGFIAGKNIDTVIHSTDSSEGAIKAVANAAESLNSVK